MSRHEVEVIIKGGTHDMRQTIAWELETSLMHFRIRVRRSTDPDYRKHLPDDRPAAISRNIGERLRVMRDRFDVGVDIKVDPPVPGRPGANQTVYKEDHREPKGGWAPGEYINRCGKCTDLYIGDKRSVICADCAYSDNQEEYPNMPDVSDREEEREVFIP